MRFKVGDKVKVKSLEWYKSNESTVKNIDFVFEMTRYCGSDGVITRVYGKTKYSIMFNGKTNVWTWRDEMLEYSSEEQACETMNQANKSEELTEEPCGYCNGTKVIVADQKYDQTWAAVSDGYLHLENSESCYSEKINFCPMCGRKLNND